MALLTMALLTMALLTMARGYHDPTYYGPSCYAFTYCAPLTMPYLLWPLASPAPADKVHVWCKEGPDGERGTGAMEEQPEKTHPMAEGAQPHLTLTLPLSRTLSLTPALTRTRTLSPTLSL